jgi:hypothetical protein
MNQRIILSRHIRQTIFFKRHTESLQVNAEKTKYMLLSRHQNAGQNHDIKIGNRCFENVAQFRYLGRADSGGN